MKQKVVIKLQMDCDKCRNKSLKIAAQVPGVTTVSIEGDDKDRVAVTGDNIDTVCLANMLKKKFRSVMILSVEEVKTADQKKKEEEKKKEEAKKKLEELKRTLELFGVIPCTICHNTSCHGECDKCSKCKCKECDGTCVTICVNCKSSKCHGGCNRCKKCQSPKCHGDCNRCKKCESPKCNGECKLRCTNCNDSKCHGCKPCPPPWCYVPYPPPCNPYPPCPVVYEPCSDPCSIM